jgi:hypothetical protein
VAARSADAVHSGAELKERSRHLAETNGKFKIKA